MTYLPFVKKREFQCSTRNTEERFGVSFKEDNLDIPFSHCFP